MHCSEADLSPGLPLRGKPAIPAAGAAGPADTHTQTLCPPRVAAVIRGPTFTPAKMPVVDTLKSRYASMSGEDGLNTLATFFFGMSSADRKTLGFRLSQGGKARFLLGRPTGHSDGGWAAGSGCVCARAAPEACACGMVTVGGEGHAPFASRGQSHMQVPEPG